MALKNFGFRVDINGINPNMITNAGTQGDHCATKIKFILSDELYDNIVTIQEQGNVVVRRFDVYDGEGGIWQSDTTEISGTVEELILEERHTRFGGKITVYLVITELSQDNETQMELYSFPAVIQLKNRPEGVCQDDENCESMTTLAEITKQKAAEACESAAAAENTKKELEEIVAVVEEKLEKGKFDGVGVESAEIIDDELIITYTNSVVQNLGNVKGDTGSQGEKGDKGEKGDTPSLDNYYTKNEIDDLDCVRNTYEEEKYFSVNSPSQNQYIDLYDDGDMDINAFGNNINVNNAKILNVATPQNDTDAATKGYVDGLVGDIETLLGGI